MDGQSEILLVLGMMLVTFGVRYPTLAIVGRIELPPSILRGLKYVPVAVLTAIIAPAAVIQDEHIALSLSNAYIIGAIVAIAVSWKTKNLLWTILIGMTIFLLWRAVM